MKKSLFIILVLSCVYGLGAQVTEPLYDFAAKDFARARTLLDEKLIRLAERELVSVIRSYPENAAMDKAAMMRAEIDILNGNNVLAKTRLQDFNVERSNSPFVPYSLMQIAVLDYRAGDMSGAEYHFGLAKSAAELDYARRGDERYTDMAGKALYWKAIAEYKSGKNAQTAADLKELIEKYPSGNLADDALYISGLIAESERDYEKAINYFRSLRLQYPKSNAYVASIVREANNRLILRDAPAALVVLEKGESTLNSIQRGDSAGMIYEPQDYAERARENVLYLRGEASNLNGNYDQALLYFKSFQETFTDSELNNYVLLGLGWAYLNKRDYEASLANYDKVIADTGRANWKARAIAQLYRAVALKEKGDLAKAKDEFLILSLQADFPYLSIVFMELGQIYYEEKDYQNANKALERAEREANDPVTQVRALLLAGAAQMELTQWQRAVELYEKAEQTARNQDEKFMPQKKWYLSEARYKRGVSLVKNRKSNEAIAVLSAFIAEEADGPRKHNALFWLSEAYYQSDMLTSAIEIYESILENYPATERKEDVLYSLGWSYFRKRNFRKSGEIFDRMISEFPNSPYAVDALTRQADAYHVEKNYVKAAEYYRRAAKMDPKSDEGRYSAFQLCDALYRAGKYEEAITALLSFVKTYRSSSLAPNALYLIGWIRFQQKRYGEAIDNFRFLIESYPQSVYIPRAYYAIADAAYNMGDYQKAMEGYKYVIDNYPTSDLAPESMRGVQQSLVLMGRQEEAIVIINEYTEKNQNSPFAREFKSEGARILFDTRKYDAAIREYETLLEKYPDNEKNPEAVYWIAKGYASLNNNDEAVKAYKRLESEYPQSDYAALGMYEHAMLIKKLNDVNRSDSILAALMRKYPENQVAPQAGFDRAVMKYGLADTAGAMDIYYQVAEKYSGNKYADESRYRIAMFLRNKSLNDSSRGQFEKLAKETDNEEMSAEAYYRIGEIWKRSDQADSALAAFATVRDKYPSYEDWFSLSLLTMGEIYEQKEDYAKAKEVYSILLELRPEDEFGKTAEKRLKRVLPKVEE